MASRSGLAGRGGQCGTGPSGAARGLRNPPNLTRSAQLRAAKSAAFVKEQTAKDLAEATRIGESCGTQRKPRVPRFTKGPPPAEPRRIDMSKPTMTKTMLARMKHAEELTKNLASQRNEATFQKRAVRPPPPGGRVPKRKAPSPPRRPPPPCAEPREDWRPQGALQEAAASNPAFQKLMKMRDTRARKGAEGAQPGSCPRSPNRREGGLPPPQAHSSMMPRSRRGSPGPGADLSAISEKTCELAQSMNAEVVQAEPVGEGPVQNIVIPPGAVSQCRTTIVALPDTSGGSANRSMQLINETLDEQDAIESASVNNRLCELQHARRDFVLAVANVGNNAINLSERGPPPCPTPQRGLYQLPDVEEDRFRVEYGRDHPSVMAAREFERKMKSSLHQREQDARMEREFARVAREEGGLRLDVPLEQEIMEGDISFEEDEGGFIIPCASRIRASMPPIPRKNIAAVTDAIGPDELERFFNPAAYPSPCPQTDDFEGAPPGREGLNPDLWEIDDPWYKECPQPDMPDLMDFNDCY